VFESNGGADTIVGQVRPQDIFNGDALDDQRVVTAFGAADGMSALTAAVTASVNRLSLLDRFTLFRDDHVALNRIDLHHHAALKFVPHVASLTEDMFDLDLADFGNVLGRTMVNDLDDLAPLDIAAPVSVLPEIFAVDSAAFDRRLLLNTEYDITPF
jgi:hypothetical protein